VVFKIDVKNLRCKKLIDQLLVRHWI